MPNAVLLPRQVHKHISTVDVEQRTIENHRNLVDGKRGTGQRGRADGGVAA
jgi:hypothetical protein